MGQPTTNPLDRTMNYTALALIVGYGVSLAGIGVIAILQDGALAQQAMDVYSKIAIGSTLAGGAWGTAHTVVTNIMHGARGQPPQSPSDPPATAATGQ